MSSADKYILPTEASCMGSPFVCFNAGYLTDFDLTSQFD